MMKDRKRQFSQQQLGELSLPILRRLDENPRLKAAHTLLLYYSLPDEVDTHTYVDHLLNLGKRILLPMVVDDENMIIREYTGKTDLRQGAFHIWEPTGRIVPPSEYKDIEVGVIPGVSFDKDRNRLGRGKGYYDRFLRQVPHLYKIGVCFDFQKTDHLPCEPTDIPMDELA